jgi:crossover junction endodeoxyribonuclease RuvC
MSKQSICVLGIDPGLATTGYGVVEYKKPTTTCKEYGIISTKVGTPLPQRLLTIHTTIQKLVETYTPDVVAIEQLFFAKNVKTAFAVGQARGVAILGLAASHAQIVEYSPVRIKQIIVGYGKADKMQVQKMVRIALNLKEIPKPDDAADALAAALCWIYSEGRTTKTYGNNAKRH